ncbi:MAG: helix-turn-helix transcriptional regulator [Burkholderiaceae bacterium]
MSTEHGYLARQLGDGLTAIREAQGVGRDTVADGLGISKVTLRELEVGLANPTLARIERVADGLDVEVTITVKPRKRARR